MSRALLFLGHGTRDDAGTAEFQAAADAVAKRLRLAPAAWDTAFLELRAPDLPTGIRNAHRRGVTDLLLAPVLLLAAGHLKQDIPALVEVACADCPGLRVHLADALGVDDRLIQAGWQRLLEASYGGDGDAVLFVGRGNRDPDALSQLRVIADRIRHLAGDPPFELGVLAGIGPSLETAVQRLVATRPRRLVVLPYLLFQGYLTRTLPQRVTAAVVAALGDAGAILPLAFARHLGPHPLVVEALTDRIHAAGAVPSGPALP